MALFLHRMASTGLTMSELAARLPRYHRRIGKVAYEHGRLGVLMLNLEESFGDAEMDRTDGLKLIWPNRWIHVRASNTEPLLRFSVEAKTEEEMEALYADVANRLR
jgi:phosphomannomutase